MKSKVIRSTHEFLELKESWERLQRDNSSTTYNNTFEYNFSYWKCFGEENRLNLFIFTVKDKSGEVVAILPLTIRTSYYAGLPIKNLEFLAKGDQNNFIIVDDNTNVTKVFNLLFNCLEECKAEFDKVNLTHINSNSPFSDYLFKHQQYNKYFNLLVETPVLIKSNHQSLTEYKKKYLSKNVKNLNNRLIKDVNYSFEVRKGDCIEEIAQVHKEQQMLEKRGSRRSLFENENYIYFLKELYSKNEHLTFMMKDQEGKVIAYQTAYFYRGTLLFWNMGYDLNYSKYSIGRICIYKMIEYFFEHPDLQVLDFGSGRYPWKFQWTRDMVSLYKLELYIKDTKKIQLIEKIKMIKRGIRCLLTSLRKHKV